MARNVVVTTARVMMNKTARAMVAGATRTTTMTVTVTMTVATAMAAATMTPNSDKHNNQILSRHQRRGTWW